jgi:hypothetical protein
MKTEVIDLVGEVSNKDEKPIELISAIAPDGQVIKCTDKAKDWEFLEVKYTTEYGINIIKASNEPRETHQTFIGRWNSGKKEIKKKPIEFIKWIDMSSAELLDPLNKPSDFGEIAIIGRSDGMDILKAIYDNAYCHFYLGHFNDGVVE